MTPKEKAGMLVLEYMTKIPKMEIAKQCALIAAKELFMNNNNESMHDYWLEVKQEIENL